MRNRCSPARAMEHILPVCFQQRGILIIVSLVIVVFPPGRKLRLLVPPGSITAARVVI